MQTNANTNPIQYFFEKVNSFGIISKSIITVKMFTLVEEYKNLSIISTEENKFKKLRTVLFEDCKYKISIFY